jgi:uncharacterized OsmC-like protein
MAEYGVMVGAGSLRDQQPGSVTVPHRWTDQGVTVRAAFTGAHLLHLAVAGCVLNDVYREAEQVDLVVRGVRVTADGGFDTETWRSTGIRYHVEVDTDASQDAVHELLARVDAVAEIPEALRAGMQVDSGRG